MAPRSAVAGGVVGILGAIAGLLLSPYTPEPAQRFAEVVLVVSSRPPVIRFVNRQRRQWLVGSPSVALVPIASGPVWVLAAGSAPDP